MGYQETEGATSLYPGPVGYCLSPRWYMELLLIAAGSWIKPSPADQILPAPRETPHWPT